MTKYIFWILIILVGAIGWHYFTQPSQLKSSEHSELSNIEYQSPSKKDRAQRPSQLKDPNREHPELEPAPVEDSEAPR